jgi:ssDNA thymidine ADP-ribosyltransferase, DarT
LICHVTPCHRLPSIFAQGGLLSYNERQAREIEEDAAAHYWGREGRKEALGDYVICSFMPSWGLMRGHDDDLVIIILDALSICCRPGVLFCPTNSARSMYTEEEILAMRGLDAFDACFQNPDTYQAGESEVLVPQIVPLTDLRGLVFWDEGARSHWRDEVTKALNAANPPPALPPKPIPSSAAGAAGMWGFRFPGQWRPARTREEP